MASCFAHRPASSVLAGLSAALFALLLGGCGNPSGSAGNAETPINAAHASQTSKLVDAGRAPDYQYDIRYPRLPKQWAPLDAAMRSFAATAKRDTLKLGGKGAGKDDPPHTLDLDFDVARHTSDFVSVLANGSAFTGGAHRMPIQASFNLFLGSGKLVSLADLFTDPGAALNALSSECRRQLQARFESQLREQAPATMTAQQVASNIQSMRHWVEQGTQPQPGNFDVFLVDGLDSKAIGLTLIFPPYQVASYADGPQQVEVPARVFYDLLKPEYHDAFAIDANAQTLRPGAR